MQRDGNRRLNELRSRKRFQILFDLMPLPMVIVDANGNLLAINNAVEKATGFKRKELVGKNIWRTRMAIVKSNVDLKNILDQRMKGIRIQPYEVEVITRNNRRLPCEVNAVKINYENKPADLVVFHTVTEKKVMEKRLSALNFHGRKLNTAGDLQEIYELTLDAMEQTLGFQHAAILTMCKGKLRTVCQRGYPALLHLELPLDETKKGITVKAVKTRKPILVEDTRKNEDYVEGIPGIRSELAVPIEMEERILGVLNVENKKPGAFDKKDVTLLQILASHAATAISNLQKRVELGKRSSQLALLMRISTRIISSIDLHQRLQTIAEAIRELGWRRVVISVRDENLDIANPGDMVTAGLTKREKEFLWNNKKSGYVWQERFGPEYERFRIDDFYHLQWSDPWVREKFSNGTVPSKLQSKDMIDWNPQDLLYAPLRLADGRIVGMISIDDPIDGKRPTKESLAPLELFIHQAAVAIENAQLIHSLNIAKEQLKADAEQLELKVEERTRELKKSQEQLVKAQRLAAIGELASMIGHDLRNPLTGIAGATYYLKSKLGSVIDRRTKEMLEIIERDVEYSNKIVNDLLEYSREMQLELTDTNPRLITKEALSLVQIPENIEILNLTQNRPKTKVDVQKMVRVFVNIVKNAVDAMPDGGKLTITSIKKNGNVEYCFTDTGAGISTDVLEKIWVPLFTTKAKGMGLGLPICKRIVLAHGGDISVESKIGKGTILTIIVPLKSKLEGGEKIWMNMPESLLSMTMRV